MEMYNVYENYIILSINRQFRNNLIHLLTHQLKAKRATNRKQNINTVRVYVNLREQFLAY